MFKLRPHHLLCNLFFQGLGYDNEFVENFRKINQALAVAPTVNQIQIVKGVDDVCRWCPKNRVGMCLNDSEVTVRDDAYLSVLQLVGVTTISLQGVKERIQSFLSKDQFLTICQQCSWNYLCDWDKLSLVI